MVNNMASFTVRNHRVFLSYVQQDKYFANNLANELLESGVNVKYEEIEFNIGDNINESIGKIISSSDFIFILLSSHSVNSSWMQRNFSEKYIDELIARDVTIVSVLIDNTSIPVYLRRFQTIDLKSMSKKNVNNLVKQIISAPRIDFSTLDGRKFELLIADLLKKLGFINVKIGEKIGDYEADIIAEYNKQDPFNLEFKEHWIIETKFYRKERVSTRTLNQLVGYILGISNSHNIALITNSQLSSYAKNWLKNIQSKERLPIRLVEGPELKKLLLKYPVLIDKYFINTNRG